MNNFMTFYNLNEIDSFFKDTNYENSLKKKRITKIALSVKQIEIGFQCILAKKTPGPHGQLYQMFKKEILPVLHKPFQKIEKEYVPTLSPLQKNKYS